MHVWECKFQDQPIEIVFLIWSPNCFVGFRKSDPQGVLIQYNINFQFIRPPSWNGNLDNKPGCNSTGKKRKDPKKIAKVVGDQHVQSFPEIRVTFSGKYKDFFMINQNYFFGKV